MPPKPPKQPSLDSLVLQHLVSRGYAASADMLRKELGAPADDPKASTSDGTRPTLQRLLQSSAAPAYAASYRELRDWVRGSLDAYQPELRQVLFPFFAHCYLALVQSAERAHAAAFADEFGDELALRHREELNLLRQVSAPAQLEGHAFARRLLGERYEVTLSAYARALLVRFLQSARQVALLGFLNERMTLGVARLQPAAQPDGVVAAAAQAWLSLSEEEARHENAAPVACGPLRAVHEKHIEIKKVVAPHLFAPPEGEGEEAAEEAEGGRGGRGRAKREEKRKRARKKE